MTHNLILLILLLFTVQITYQRSFHSRHSLQTRYNQTAYATELAKRQQQFDNKMKDIQTQVNQLDANISKFQGNDTYQIMKLQEGLADERDSLYDVENSLNQPFLMKPCQKPNLTEEEKLKLNQQINTTKSSLLNMKGEVKKCTSQSIDICTVPDELIHQITRAELYLDVMNDYVNGNCSRVPRTIAPQEALGLVDLNDRLFKDNLKAPNWIYGNITEQQYRLIVFSETTKFNMTTCPLQTPFSNKVNNTCFNCPDGSIFSLGQRICTCQKGYKFDQQTNQCVSLTPVKPCNQTGTCVSMCPKDKPHWNSVNKICELCPAGMPIVNRTSNTCEACPSMKPLWNQITYTCEECPKNSHFVPKQAKCVPCKDDQKYDQKIRKCVPICRVNQIYKPQEGKCYTSQQLNGCKCSQRYNQTLKDCEDVCENGLQWLSSQKKCGPPSLPDFKDSCKYYQRLNKQNNECQNYCDSTVAWYDRQNHVCIKIGCSVQCKCGEIFDNLTGKCIPEGQQCPNKQFYNTSSGQCQIICKQNQVYNSQTKICEASITTCAFDEKYDAQNLKCVKKCSGNFEVYNSNTTLCDCVTGYIKDKLTGKCITAGQQCPTQQFYNTSSGQCQIICKQNQIYSSQTKICEASITTCAFDEKYDAQNLKCVKKCSGNFEVYNLNTTLCDCVVGYVRDPSRQCVSIQSSCTVDNFQKYNKQTMACECIQGYHVDPSIKKCVKNPIQCDFTRKQIYDKAQNKCICSQGLKLDNQNNCVSICNDQSNKIYSLDTKQCVCKPDHYLSVDGLYCLHISQRCLPANNMFYNQTLKSCQCNLGFYMNSEQKSCISIATTCLAVNNQRYDSAKMSCVCNPGFVLNTNANRCQSQQKNCNQTLHFVFNSQTTQCVCSAGYKLSADKLSCNSHAEICLRNPNTNFNAVSLSCECIPGYKLLSQNGDTLVCQALCKVDQNYNLNTQQCVDLCPFDYYYNLTTHSCAYRCQADYTYNNVTKQCERLVKVCPDPVNQFYDQKSGQCHYCPSGYTLNTYTLLCQKKTISCPQGQFLDTVTGTCKFCRSGQIYNILTKVCEFVNMTCSGGMYFDFNAGVCKTCLSGTIYDQSLLQCRSNCTMDQIFDYSTKKCVLISSTCNFYQYYDQAQRKCVNKPVCLSTQRYDQLSRKCVDIRMITSKTAKNLVHSNFSAYEKYYDQQKSKDMFIKDCPQGSPFYQSSSKFCVLCPQTNPYFNLETEKCQDCGNDKYDVILKKCVNNNVPVANNGVDVKDLDYSLDRLMMNII